MLGKVFLFLVCYNGCGKNRFLANGEAASFREKTGFFPKITFRCISNLVSPGAIEEITVDQVWSALEPFLPPQEGFEQIRAADSPHGS